MDKVYKQDQVEQKWYKIWQDAGYFKPEINPNGAPYTIILPPPNVTGTLHIGHALMLTIEDILIRYHRMLGDKTLWLPGTDHAAIATNAKVEAILFEEGKTKYDLGREVFLKRVEDFAQASHDTIVNQIRSMGASVDWDREAYTLDEKRNLAVREAFKRMFDLGLIYRGDTIVNWDPKLQTTVSDDEITWVEQKTPLYYLKYGPFTIATARPETKFGDKYVVMHPKDKRYSQYKDADKIEVEWINGKVTATIVKDEAIDMEFGTGVMTITPWHDKTDFEIARRHNLDATQIIDFKGLLLEIAGEFKGQHIKKARPQIVEKLKQKGLLVKTDENYTHRLATNYRGGGIIEPQIKKQWMIDVNKEFILEKSQIKGIPNGAAVTLKGLMKQVVESGQIKITPDKFVKIYYHWIDNLRDWCISRQIWYGHQIPVWYCNACQFAQTTGATNATPSTHVSVEDLRSCRTCGSTDIVQDPDTLDTWFSSGLWTFSTLGWPPSKIWDLNISDGQEIFDSLENNIKRFETRAGKPGGTDRDWNQFKVGDIINFSLVEEGTNKILSDKIITKQIVSMHHFASVDELLKKFDVKEIHPYKPEDYRKWWESRPQYKERIEKYGIWAFELTDWDLKVYHPTSVLETGYDILFFWVARMILMTTSILGDIPFKEVYLHGIVRDAQKQKMSKSKGNVIDPLSMSEKYGTDALRLALVFGTAAGNDIPMSEDKIRGMRNFTNKLWNIGRFIIDFAPKDAKHLDSDVIPNEVKNLSRMREVSGTSPEILRFTQDDSEIIEKLNHTAETVTKALNSFRLHDGATALYEFIWHEFADKYIESTKERRSEAQPVLEYVFRSSLELLHPFMPYITEELWQKLPHKGESIMISQWPKTK